MVNNLYTYWHIWAKYIYRHLRFAGECGQYKDTPQCLDLEGQEGDELLELQQGGQEIEQEEGEEECLEDVLGHN